MQFDKQVDEACNSIRSDPKLYGQTINVVGLSQGGLIGRGVVEFCDFGGRVARLISIGGPQMGVATIPKCHSGFACNILNGFADDVVYLPEIQQSIGPAGYFRDPKEMQKYLEHSIFLPRVNNEKQIDEIAKSRFNALEKLHLTMFEKDTVIDPKETAWFGFYGQDAKTIINMQEQQVFTQDLFGLKSLSDSNRIEYLTINADHLRFTNMDIDKYYIPALL